MTNPHLMLFRPLLAGLSLMLSTTILCAQSAVGTWKTVDDETGEIKSHIEIYERQGKLNGKIVQTLRKNAPKNCETCTGARAGKPFVGMEIISDAAPDGAKTWEGKIYDPEADTTYTLVMWLEKDANVLYVRGKHWTGLYRTQTWSRVK